MLKYLFSIPALLFVSVFLVVCNPSFASAQSLGETLRGKILLQVESHGEAWYVSPKDNQRYYMGRPTDAFKLMRDQGIDVTNANLEKIPIGDISIDGPDDDGDGLTNSFEDAIGTDPQSTDTDQDGYDDKTEVRNNYNPIGNGKIPLDLHFAKTQQGKILLAVERHGESWYINPNNNKRYFLGRPQDAFSLMRNLGLGISNTNLIKIAEYKNSQNNVTSTSSHDNTQSISSPVSPENSHLWKAYNEEVAAFKSTEHVTVATLNKYSYFTYKEGFSTSDCAHLKMTPEECQSNFQTMVDNVAKNGTPELAANDVTIYEDDKQGIIFSTQYGQGNFPNIFGIKDAQGVWKIVLTRFSNNKELTDPDHDGISTEDELCEGKISSYSSTCIKTDPTKSDTDKDGW